MAFPDSTEVAALIPEQAVQEIQQGVFEGGSVALGKMRRLQNMARQQLRIPVLSALPTAYFVAGSYETPGNSEPGLKRTTKMEWANKYLYAEEVAVIVPIAQDLLDDSAYDIWTEVRPALVEAFGVVIDGAIFHGTGAPTSWPDDILTAATAAGNVVAEGAGADLYDDILSEDGLYAKVENDGFMVTGAIGTVPLKAKLRGLRSSTEGLPIFKAAQGVQGASVYTLEGVPVEFATSGGLDATAALLVAGQWDKLVYSVRQDMSYTILTEATIYDTDGTTILYNLAQQDMVALRAVMRLGWQCPNPINRMQATEGNRYPLAVLTPESGS
jgi:HK97 family phage major capsid protein